MESVGPPLAGSPWVTGSPERLVRIVLHGVRGPINVGENEFNLEMPAMGFFSDEEVAAILTFARNSWGNDASVIYRSQIEHVRKTTSHRRDSWTVEELLSVH
jgi:mono/diheme cytochrome c family protein